MGFHVQRQCPCLCWQPRQPEGPRCWWCFYRYLLGLQAAQDGRCLHVGPPLRSYQGDVKLPLGPQLCQWKGRVHFILHSILSEKICYKSKLFGLFCRTRMTGWALPAMVMDPPSLSPSMQIRLAEMDGFASTDGVRSSELKDKNFIWIGEKKLLTIVLPQSFLRNMVIFRNVVNGQPHSNWWDNQSNQVAFGRGNRGFIVINNDDWWGQTTAYFPSLLILCGQTRLTGFNCRNLDMTLNTGMPGGSYCDVISGQKEGHRCTGKTITVGGDGRAHFSISNRDEDPFVAIHADSKL